MLLRFNSDRYLGRKNHTKIIIYGNDDDDTDWEERKMDATGRVLVHTRPKNSPHIILLSLLHVADSVIILILRLTLRTI